MAAFLAGMVVAPIEPCSSMARRMPHMNALILMEAPKPVYFPHGGLPVHQPFTAEVAGQHIWLIDRSPENNRDEDCSREDKAESL